MLWFCLVQKALYDERFFQTFDKVILQNEYRFFYID